jgi:UDP-glucose 4-epimerase
MYFSTSEVYGKIRSLGLAESEVCCFSSAPRWSYAAAKLVGEWLALDEKWQVVRLFNVIGPNQNPAYGAVFPRFVSQSETDQPLTIYGDGSQVRTFTSVHDVVCILDSLRDKTFDVVNVGSTNTLSIRQLATRIKELTGSHSGLEYVDYEKAYPAGFEECPSRIPDLTKLRSLIGNYEFRSLENMIQEVSHARQTVCK